MTKMNRKRLFSLLFALLTAIVFVLPVCAENTPATLQLEVAKVITGDSPATDGTFSFQLQAVDEGIPMPAKDTITITGEGKASFEAITYDTPGDYHYTIRELNGKLDDYTYDTSVFDVTVQVICDENDPTVLLATAYVSKNNGKDKYNKIEFVNQYTAPDSGNTGSTPTPAPTQTPAPAQENSNTGSPLLPQTGDLFNPALWGVLCAAALVLLIVVWVVKKRKTNKNK